MEVTKDIALKLWKDVFGDNLWAQDCFGTWMHRDDYGNYDKTRNNRPNGTGNSFVYGWDVDHIRPKSSFKDEKDSNFFNNFEPMQHSNNLKKSDGYPNFKIDDTEFKVVECEICKKNNLQGYGILRVSTNKRIDLKFIQNSFYK
jgi:hypothetical protein